MIALCDQTNDTPCDIICKRLHMLRAYITPFNDIGLLFRYYYLQHICKCMGEMTSSQYCNLTIARISTLVDNLYNQINKLSLQRESVNLGI